MAKALARTSASFIGRSPRCYRSALRIKLCSRSAILLREIKGKDPVRAVWPSQHLRMAKRTNRVAVARLPVLLHRAAGELEIFRATFIILCLVDELYKIVDLPVRLLRQHLALRCLQQVLG